MYAASRVRTVFRTTIRRETEVRRLAVTTQTHRGSSATLTLFGALRGGAAMTCVLAGCMSDPPPSGRATRRATEQAIDRFCLCGTWPGECPAYRASEEELACLDRVYEEYAPSLRAHAACSAGALEVNAECLLEPGADCEACQNAWSLNVANCPQIPMEIRPIVDSCL